MTDDHAAAPAEDATRPEPDTSMTRPEPGASSSAIKSPAHEPEIIAPSTDVELAPDLGRGVMIDASIDARIRYARELANAGLLPGEFRRNPGNVLYAVEFGNMLGIHPLAAITGVHVMDGKPTASPALMSALVRRAGHKLRVRVTGTVEGGDLAATATLIRADDPDEPFVAKWTIARAQRAELVDSYRANAEGSYEVVSLTPKGKPSSWQKFPEAMCKARAIGEVCREGAEEALCGVHYTPEELGVQVDADGVVIVETSLVDTPEAESAETVAARVARLAQQTRDRVLNTTTLDALTALYTHTAGLPDAAAIAEAEVANADGAVVTVKALFTEHGRKLKGEADGGGAQRPAEPSGPDTPPAPGEAESVQQELSAADSSTTPDPYQEPISAEVAAGVEASADEASEAEAAKIAQLDDTSRAAWERFGRRDPYVGAGSYGAVASYQLDDELASDPETTVERAEALAASARAWLVQADLDEHVEAEPVPSRQLASSKPRAEKMRRERGL